MATYSSSNGIGTWSGWSGAAPSGGLTLSLTAAVAIATNGTGASAYCSAAYTLDGHTWSSFFTTTSTLASANYSAPIPAGTNLANVQVTVSALPSSPESAANSVSASVSVSNLQIA